MSRVGKKPIDIPSGVDAKIEPVEVAMNVKGQPTATNLAPPARAPVFFCASVPERG